MSVPHSRRDFLISALAGILSAGTSSRFHYLTGWTQQPFASVSPGQFDIQKVATDVFFALARLWGSRELECRHLCELV
ncbi:MAG: hypothetical protein DMG96_40460 [Acidobacteria bacterium]|nr:MAG: hypothetical protein DMG96_40460 [Acidobacteriota bacterium]